MTPCRPRRLVLVDLLNSISDDDNRDMKYEKKIREELL